ncbi:MAG: type IV secretion system protein [bacterium]
MDLTTDILTRVDAITLGYTAKAYQAVVSTHATELRLMLVAYFALYGMAVLQGFVPLSMGALAKHIVKVGIVYSVATNWGTFTVFCYNLFTSGPDKLMGALVGGSNPSAQLGVVFDKGMSSASLIYENAGKFDMGQMSVAFVLMISTVLLTAYGLFLLVLSKLGLAVLLSLGPIFVPFALWSSTKGLFQAWLNYLINYALIPVITLGILGLIISILDDAVQKIQAVGDRPLIYHTFPFLLTGSITVLLLAQVTRLASTLGGGVALSTEAIFQRAMRVPRMAKGYALGAAKVGRVAVATARPAFQRSAKLYRNLKATQERFENVMGERR